MWEFEPAYIICEHYSSVVQSFKLQGVVIFVICTCIWFWIGVTLWVKLFFRWCRIRMIFDNRQSRRTHSKWEATQACLDLLYTNMRSKKSSVFSRTLKFLNLYLWVTVLEALSRVPSRDRYLWYTRSHCCCHHRYHHHHHFHNHHYHYHHLIMNVIIIIKFILLSSP